METKTGQPPLRVAQLSKILARLSFTTFLRVAQKSGINLVVTHVLRKWGGLRYNSGVRAVKPFEKAPFRAKNPQNKAKKPLERSICALLGYICVVLGRFTGILIRDLFMPNTDAGICLSVGSQWKETVEGTERGQYTGRPEY